MSTNPQEFRSIPVAALVFSKTKAQTERRSHFDKAAMKELAESIRAHGVMQPILVRPRFGDDHGALNQWEVVAGERRAIASKSAGVAEVPAMVRELTDEQVLELQLIENLQREDLHELAEAEGYESLQKLGHSIDDMAAKTGKSKATIYARMKLLALGAPAREAFYIGKISASIALLLARIPVESVQKEALKQMIEDRWNDGAMSYRQASDLVQRKYMLRLGEAPFPTEDDQLVRGTLPCGRCPKNTIAQPELFGDVKASRAGVCTDPTCFAAKKEAHVRRSIDAAKAAGQMVLEGKAAKEVFPHGTYSAHAGYVRLDSEKYAGGRSHKVSALVGKAAEPVLVRTNEGELIPVIKESALRSAMKAKGIKDERPRGLGHAADKKQRARRETEELYRNAVLARIVKQAPGSLSRADLELVASELAVSGDFGDEEFAVLGWPAPKGSDWKRHAKMLEAQLPKLTNAALNGLILFLALVSAVGNQTFNAPHDSLEKCAKRLHIDTAAIKKELETAAGVKAVSKTKKTKPVPAKKKAKSK